MTILTREKENRFETDKTKMLTLLQLEMFLSPVLPYSDANGQVSLLGKRKTRCLMKQTTQPE